MKILWYGFAGKNHSWSLVAQNICRELIKKGHEVDIFSTNGNSHFPKDLDPNLIGYINENDFNIFGRKPCEEYQIQLSYTAMKNFGSYFTRGNKNRFGIWNYETTVLPKSFAKYYKYVDKMLPSSEFSKKIFTDNGVPENAQVVIPHGVNLNQFKNTQKFDVKSEKKYKILANIAQPHLRKNIPGLLKAWGLAFTNKDDVSLVVKISKRGANGQGDVNFDSLLKDFKSKFKNHAEIKIIDYFIDDMVPLYNACDAVITMSHTENYYLPGIECFAAGKVAIGPRYGGQLDYMNDDNSILIDGKIIRADYAMQYWEPSPYASVFDPSASQCAEKLQDLIKNYEFYQKKFAPGMKEKLKEHNWSNVADNILSLCEK
jgi:glycosyltransferase involved in cell wall biosynthesis